MDRYLRSMLDCKTINGLYNDIVFFTNYELNGKYLSHTEPSIEFDEYSDCSLFEVILYTTLTFEKDGKIKTEKVKCCYEVFINEVEYVVNIDRLLYIKVY